MKEFTFITLAYNHEKYIVEHLDSIKRICSHYGQGINANLIVVDDCSTDNTCKIIENWLLNYSGVFNKVIFQKNFNNQGVIHNIFWSIDNCQTENFKFLAGDDLYYDSDIFTLIDSIPANTVVSTPVIPFGSNQISPDLIYRFRMLLYSYKKNNYKSLLKYDNFIQAPGVFARGNTFRDPRLKKSLSFYRNIEDYPMWHYLLIDNGYELKVLVKPFIKYRVNSGISTNKKHMQCKSYNSDVIEIRKRLDVRRYRFPTFVNIFRYCYMIKKIELFFNKNKINSLITYKDLDVYKV